VDNGSSHTSKATKAWPAEHPRFRVTYTPVHASWSNIVEIFFSILARRMLRRGDFASRQDLIDKTPAFIATYNQTAKPSAGATTPNFYAPHEPPTNKCVAALALTPRPRLSGAECFCLSSCPSCVERGALARSRLLWLRSWRSVSPASLLGSTTCPTSGAATSLVRHGWPP
jgi:hypothetical protein